MKVTKEEEEKLRRGECPDCGSKEFLEGPHGGLAVNIRCANPKCKSRFNIAGPFTPERI